MGDFEESDVIWPDHLSIDDPYRPISSSASFPPRSSDDRRHQRKEDSCSSCSSAFSSSPPVRIPTVRRAWKLEFTRPSCDEEDDDDGEMVPPHVTVARRIAGKMAFSVCTGNGRTLKGRDLSQVRNSVLRMTGFLEG